MAKIVTYECNECGCEVVVTKTPETELMPIYCCGLEVKEVPLSGKKVVRPKKKIAKKTAKKSVKKEVIRKKKPAVKKKGAKKS